MKIRHICIHRKESKYPRGTCTRGRGNHIESGGPSVGAIEIDVGVKLPASALPGPDVLPDCDSLGEPAAVHSDGDI